jgi:predicted Zn-dependent peptidase
MIDYEKFTLDNGLRVLVHEDHSTPLACINILYDVGARDEDPKKTGFAHLFEHLMFGGSINIPSYDTPLQQVGGENNAFTNNDITNYYLSLPADNIETGFWLESDRMLSLAFSEKSLEVQRNVVVEEFKQRYLNQPYGDEWLLLRPLAYKNHPYRWATIGEEISHIENARMEDVKNFFKTHYHPSNAILVVSGDVRPDEVRQLCDKWFAGIPAGEKKARNLPVEPVQGEPRFLEVFRDVPADSLTRVYHICGRNSEHYFTHDLLSDLLGRGTSSRLYIALVKEKQFFSSISAYVTGNIDPGLLVIQGKVNPGVSIIQADEAVSKVIDNFLMQGISEEELEKVKNKAESTLVFEEMSILNKAMGLAFAELLGDANLVNTEIERMRKVSAEMLMIQAKSILKNENCSTLYYRKNQ